LPTEIPASASAASGSVKCEAPELVLIIIN